MQIVFLHAVIQHYHFYYLLDHISPALYIKNFLMCLKNLIFSPKISFIYRDKKPPILVYIFLHHFWCHVLQGAISSLEIYLKSRSQHGL